jgi:hypothetical protein
MTYNTSLQVVDYSDDRVPINQSVTLVVVDWRTKTKADEWERSNDESKEEHFESVLIDRLGAIAKRS